MNAEQSALLIDAISKMSENLDDLRTAVENLVSLIEQLSITSPSGRYSLKVKVDQ